MYEAHAVLRSTTMTPTGLDGRKHMCVRSREYAKNGAPR